MKYVPVENSNHLVRDKSTNAIINIDNSGLEKAKARKKARIEKDQKINKLENEINELKSLVQALAESN
jgi:hypothetical protein